MEKLLNLLIDLNNKNKDFLRFVFNWKEWFIFFKRSFAISLFSIALFFLWLFPISLFVAPFYSITQDKVIDSVKYDIEGKTTTFAIRDGIQELLDEGLVTNFTGVKTWIDNKYYEQVGEIEIYRVAINSLENNLGRNRGTGGAHPSLVSARANVYADYDLPIFTSYTTRLKQTISDIEDYVEDLERNKDVKMSEKSAVFIVNSDNLAQTLDKVKQQLQTNLVKETTFLTEDDKFYRIKGNLIALSHFLKGIDFDFKNKMIDKTSYTENFVPLLEAIDNAVSQNHFIVLEALGHVSKLEKEANIIAQKLQELRDKLNNG